MSPAGDRPSERPQPADGPKMGGGESGGGGGGMSAGDLGRGMIAESQRKSAEDAKKAEEDRKKRNEEWERKLKTRI